MKVLYRPPRSTLTEAMKELKTFDSLKELFEYLVEAHKVAGITAFKTTDILIMYECYDARIDWETHTVCTRRYFDKRFKYPQCIGYITFKNK